MHTHIRTYVHTYIHVQAVPVQHVQVQQVAVQVCTYACVWLGMYIRMCVARYVHTHVCG